MIDWIKTVQGIAAIVAVIFATLVALWNLGLPASCSRPSWRRCRRAVVCRKDNRSMTSRACSGTGLGAISSASTTRTPAPTTSASIPTAPISLR